MCKIELSDTWVCFTVLYLSSQITAAQTAHSLFFYFSANFAYIQSNQHKLS
jgi:hypothetical protein